jgi:hypothetical protein
MKKMDAQELEMITGGTGGFVGDEGWRTVLIASGFLAVRSAAVYDDRNIIGYLYHGDQVHICGSREGDYVWVEAPSHGCLQGYVNYMYLV